MGSISYLTQAGGLLSNLPNGITAADLQSVPPSDIVELSDAALAAQPALSAAIAANQTLPDATPQQPYAVNTEALQVQQTQELFG